MSKPSSDALAGRPVMGLFEFLLFFLSRFIFSLLQALGNAYGRALTSCCLRCLSITSLLTGQLTVYLFPVSTTAFYFTALFRPASSPGAPLQKQERRRAELRARRRGWHWCGTGSRLGFGSMAQMFFVCSFYLFATFPAASL